jgi:hypothetical protein
MIRAKEKESVGRDTWTSMGPPHESLSLANDESMKKAERMNAVFTMRNLDQPRIRRRG